MKKIPISYLSTLLFCEYKIFLKFVKKEKSPSTLAMIKGRAEHKKLNEKHEKKREIAKKVIKAIKESDLPEEEKEKKIKKITKEELNTEREQKVEGEKIKGRLDKIEFLEDNIIRIVDDKAHNRAYDGDKIQVLAYCMAYQEQHKEALKKKYPDGVVFKAAIHDYNNNEDVWEEEYTKKSEIKLNKMIDRFNGILDGSITPKSTSNYNKCSICNMRKKCTKRAVSDIDKMLHL